jgi:hypothetical protein
LLWALLSLSVSVSMFSAFRCTTVGTSTTRQQHAKLLRRPDSLLARPTPPLLALVELFRLEVFLDEAVEVQG